MLPNTPSILEELIRGLTDEELARKPARDRFSIGEVIAHLEHAERAFYGPRIQKMVDADNPRLPMYAAPAEGFGARAVRTTLESYARERAANCTFLQRIEPEDLKRTADQIWKQRWAMVPSNSGPANNPSMQRPNRLGCELLFRNVYILGLPQQDPPLRL